MQYYILSESGETGSRCSELSLLSLTLYHYPTDVVLVPW